MRRVDPTPVTSKTLKAWQLPQPGTDKESRGRVLVVGGSAQTPGAVRAAGEAALRAGGGKLQLATAASVTAALAVAVPEARVVNLPESADGVLDISAAERLVDTAADAAVVLVGPGLSDVGATVALLEQVVPRLDTTVVIDALASAFLTRHQDGLRHLAGRCVLTVNPKELSHVLGCDQHEVSENLAGAALDAAQSTGAIVLCGAATKVVAAPDGACWVTDVGGPGLGVSGSGDVQSGIVTGLLARGADPAQAAVWGAYLHGRAGERLAASLGPVGFLARELGYQIPRLLAELA